MYTPANRNVFKFSYRGKKMLIRFEKTYNYQDMVLKVMRKFRIPLDTQNLQITNDSGHVYEGLLLEYLLRHFPNPSITFHVRLPFLPHDHTENSVGIINSNREESSQRYYGAPVHRQNCFIGEIPTHLNAASNSNTAEKIKACKRKRPQNQTSISKRMRIQDAQEQ